MARKKKRNLDSLIKSALRKIWLYSDERREAKKRAKVKGLSAYRCEICSILTDKPEIDHIIPVGSGTWDERIERLFVSADKLRVLCHNCHKEVTYNGPQKETTIGRLEQNPDGKPKKVQRKTTIKRKVNRKKDHSQKAR